MASTHFEVFLSGTSISSEAWSRAINAPESELPKLSEAERDLARKMQIEPKEYARGALAEEYSVEELKKRGEILGRKIEAILGEAGDKYRLDAIVREGVNVRWVARIATPTDVKLVSLPLDLADDVIDWDAPSMIDRLRQALRAEIRDLPGSSK